MLNKLWRVASIQPEAGDSVKTRHYEVGTESGSDRVTIWQSQFSQSAATRSHPPPHAGCPRGDPGPLPVLTPSRQRRIKTVPNHSATCHAQLFAANLGVQTPPIFEKELRDMKKQYAISLLVASLLIVALAAVAGSGRSGGDSPAPPAIGAMIDDFKLPDADGAQHTLEL